MPQGIVIVEDQTVFREMLSMLLLGDGFEVPATFASGKEARDAFSTLTCDVAVVDLQLPDMSGLELCRGLLRAHPDLRTVLLTAHEKEAVVKDALQAGIHGVIMKNASFHSLRSGVAQVAKGGVFRCPRTVELVRSAARNESEPALTARESEILRLVSLGQTTKEIAHKLRLSPKTVSNHRFNIGRKLGLTDVASWTRYAIGRGLVLEDGFK